MDIGADPYDQIGVYWPKHQDPAHYEPMYSPFRLDDVRHLQLSPQQEAPPAFVPTDPAIRNGSKKRRACNECKQQKLRCDLSNLINPTSHCCSRCKRLKLDCRIDRGFRRERKRKRSDELELEVDLLRQELERRAQTGLATKSAASSRNMTPPDSAYGSERSAPAMTSSPRDAEIRRMASIHTPLIPRSSRTLDKIHLSADVVDDLFREYFTHYHTFLPIVEHNMTPERCFNSSILLFWAIVSTAARRYDGDRTLYLKLAQPVTNLVWKSLASMSHSRCTIQGLAVLCTWPFPINACPADMTYLWSGAMFQIGSQMGLHRPLNVQDFSRHRVQLSESQINETVRTWAGCSIVTQCVSMGHGLVSPVQYDWTLLSGPRNGFSAMRLESSLEFQLQIEMFRNEVSRAMLSNLSDPVGLQPTHERIPLYAMFAQHLESIERYPADLSDLNRLYILIARMHLQGFCLFDEPSSDFYAERVIMLYLTATSLIQHVLETNCQSKISVRYWPFFRVQSLIAAAFVVLKVLRNDYFRSLVNAEAGCNFLHIAIDALRNASVGERDLLCRFANVLSYLWKEAPAHIIGGHGKEGLSLKVRTRNSMSIVVDSVSRWREYIRAQTDKNEDQVEAQFRAVSIQSDDLQLGIDEHGIYEETGSNTGDEHQHHSTSPSAAPMAFFGSTDFGLHCLDGLNLAA